MNIDAKIEVAFHLQGVNLPKAEQWGELVVDACRLDPDCELTLAAVKVIPPETNSLACASCGFIHDKAITCRQAQASSRHGAF